MYPFIRIFGRDIGTYGLCLVVGFALAAILALQKGKPRGLIVEDLLIVGAFAVGLALTLGSLLYALITYSAAQILVFIQQGNFKFLSSGIVFYGGLIGGILGAVIGTRVAHCKLEIIERSVVPFIPLAHAVGRIGCIMAGCCYGFAYDGPFALYYPHSVSELSPSQGCFPVQALESVINMIICIAVLKIEKKARRTTDVLFSYLGLYSISRFFLEMLRGDTVRGIWGALSTSQIISLLLLTAGCIGLLWGRGFLRVKNEKKSAEG